MDAQRLLGDAHGHGIGVPEDHEAAVKWYRMAALQGDAEAQFQLGQIYHIGTAFPEYSEEKYKWYLKVEAALKWYRMAAEQGHVDAQFKLGYMYLNEQGTPKWDYKAAAKWLRKAAEQGDAKAQHHLGMLHFAGIGVRESLEEANKTICMMAAPNLRKEAEAGDMDAQYVLGEALKSGHKGFPKNYKEAAKWHRKAAEQGHAGSQYSSGIDVPPRLWRCRQG